MRPALFCLTTTILCTSGCAALVARSGTDPGHTVTREQVHQSFGKPVAAGTADGKTYEDFCCHTKVSENFRASILLLASCYSLGLADLYYFPCEIGRLGWKAIRGYDLRFHYDETGRVTGYTIDGVPGMPWPFDELATHASGAPRPPSPAGSTEAPAR